MILARTLKGKGVSFVEGKDGWHGKAFKKGEELDRALAELEAQFVARRRQRVDLAQQIAEAGGASADRPTPKPVAPPAYKLGDQVATREAYGTALAKLGEADERVVALDADVKNSTFSDKFEKAFPDRFYENFIAEQVMIGAAMGLAARGAIPFPSTFALFPDARAPTSSAWRRSATSTSRWPDRTPACRSAKTARRRWRSKIWRCAAPSRTSPCSIRATRSAPSAWSRSRPITPGPAYIRTSRPKTPVIYANDETFAIGGLKVLRQSASDVATVVGAGVTVFEALKAYDQLKSEGTPIRVIDLYSRAADRRRGADRRRARRPAGASSRSRITTRPAALATRLPKRSPERAFTVHRLAVREIPRSGKPDELLDRYGISARHIVEAVRAMAPVTSH